MLKNQDIICISSIDWDFVWQGHQEIMSAFAKSGNRVLFIENTGVRSPGLRDIPRLKKRFLSWLKSIKGFRQEAENIYIYSPVILPFPYSRIARIINKAFLLSALRRWMRAADFFDPIIWTFLPTGTALDIINNIDNKLVVYYCIADFNELADNPQKVENTERQLLKISDVVFAQGEALKEKCIKFNRNVHIFPFGVNLEVFERVPPAVLGIPQELSGVKRPLIGYVGGLHRHIDFGLVKSMALTHPEWTIAMVGPFQADVSVLKGIKNIMLLGKKDFSLLPQYINAFDVGIIPYELNEYTMTVYPTKLNEYHVMGVPVVSTRLPEVEKFNRQNDDLVFIADSHKDFSLCVERALQGKTEASRDKRVQSARKNSWSARIKLMSEFMVEALKEKSKYVSEWQENLIKVYKASRRKAVKLFFASVIIYASIFYTPLVWWLAEPLKVSEEPLKADCIVVFAGGVGESGKAGEGYEERVKYAVELYKAGFAEKILFSSGYWYVFKEPLLMSSLAVSLGVRQEDIILEDRAANTYENVKFSEEILKKKDYRRILLVTSPYHTRRVKLVYKKVSPDREVVYVPIPESRFYEHGVGPTGKKILRQADFRQIKSLLHEYAAITYYLLKDYARIGD